MRNIYSKCPGCNIINFTTKSLFALIHVAENLKISQDDYATYGIYLSRRVASIVYDDTNNPGRRKRQIRSTVRSPSELKVTASVGLFMDGEKIGVTKNTEEEAILLQVDNLTVYKPYNEY